MPKSKPGPAPAFHPMGLGSQWKGSGVTWTLPEPMLSTPVPSPDLRAAEPKLSTGFLRCPLSAPSRAAAHGRQRDSLRIE